MEGKENSTEMQQVIFDEVKALLASGEDTEYDSESLIAAITERTQFLSVQS